MCDALSRNTPKLTDGGEILLAHCLAHGRRQFVEVAANFPEPCRYVLETLGDVYKYDAEAREGKLSFAFALRTFELTPPLSSPAPGNDPRAS
jgi:transposase